MPTTLTLELARDAEKGLKAGQVSRLCYLLLAPPTDKVVPAVVQFYGQHFEGFLNAAPSSSLVVDKSSNEIKIVRCQNANVKQIFD